jgi:hypothetical protein
VPNTNAMGSRIVKMPSEWRSQRQCNMLHTFFSQQGGVLVFILMQFITTSTAFHHWTSQKNGFQTTHFGLADNFKFRTTTIRDLQQGQDGGESGALSNTENAKDESLKQASETEGGAFLTVRRFAQDGTSKIGSVANAAGSGVKFVAGAASKAVAKGGSDVQSAANAAGSGVKFVAGAASKAVAKGGSGVQSVANAAVSGLGGLAQKGTSDFTSTAGAAASGLSGLARKGSSDLRSTTTTVTNVFGSATSSLAGLAERGTSEVKLVVNGATTSLAGLAQKGGSETANVVQWLDTQAKDTATAANNGSKALVLSFTKKEEYQFGDITKTLIKKTAEAGKDINIADVMLLLKVLLAVGASFVPLAKILPVTMLMEMLNVSLEARLGGKIVEVLAGSLDERFTAAFKADEVGEFAKKSLTAALTAFTGRLSYESGDIERAVVEVENSKETEQQQAQQATVSSNAIEEPPTPTPPPPKTFKFSVGSELEEWDQLFRDTHPDVDLVVQESLDAAPALSFGSNESSKKALDMELISELEEWDMLGMYVATFTNQQVQ